MKQHTLFRAAGMAAITAWAALAAFPHSAAAQGGPSGDWPNRPVRLLYPYPPGGSVENMIRMVSERVARELGQQFIIENRPGAGGAIGAQAAAKAAPDGYTFGISGTPTHVIAPLYESTPYDPMKDFTHVALMGGTPVVLAVATNLGVNSVKEYVDKSRASPQGISYGSAGTGTSVHLVGERFGQISGANVVHVPYKGLIPAAMDLIGGHLPSVFSTVGQAREFHQQGKLKILAVASPSRMTMLPDVPTFIEAGYKDLVSSAWFSFSGPAGTPAPIVARFNAAVRAAVATPEVTSRLAADGISTEPRNLDPAAFTEFVRAEIERWAPVVRSIKANEKKS